MNKEQRYDWNKLKKEFRDRLKKATPDDLKDYTGLIDSKGYCDFCKQKKVLFLDRKTKKMFCSDCRPIAGYEFTAIEFNNMWELAQEILFYADEAIKELQEDSGIQIIIPDEMWETDMGKKVIEDSDKIIKAIEEHQKKRLFYLIKCPYCGTGQQFKNMAVGSHCDNPLCAAVVQSCKSGKRKGELMWSKDA